MIKDHSTDFFYQVGIILPRMIFIIRIFWFIDGFNIYLEEYLKCTALAIPYTKEKEIGNG